MLVVARPADSPMISLRWDQSGNSPKVTHNAGGAWWPSWALSSPWRAIGLGETSHCGTLPAWDGVICICFSYPSVSRSVVQRYFSLTFILGFFQWCLVMNSFQFLGRGAKSGSTYVTFLVISLLAHNNLCSHFCSLSLISSCHFPSSVAGGFPLAVKSSHPSCLLLQGLVKMDGPPTPVGNFCILSFFETWCQ